MLIPNHQHPDNGPAAPEGAQRSFLGMVPGRRHMRGAWLMPTGP